MKYQHLYILFYIFLVLGCITIIKIKDSTDTEINITKKLDYPGILIDIEKTHSKDSTKGVIKRALNKDSSNNIVVDSNAAYRPP